jgi:hypothetical protein
MSTYVPPSVTRMGSLHELTLASNIYKNDGTGDVIITSTGPISAAGDGVVRVS